MIFDMNTIKMRFVWIVSIGFLFIKKLGGQTKLKQKMYCNVKTKHYHYQVMRI